MVEAKSRLVWKSEREGFRWQLHTTQMREDIGLIRDVEGVVKVDDFIEGSGCMIVYFNSCYDTDEVKAEIGRLLNES